MRLIIAIAIFLIGICKSPAPIYPNYFTTNANPTVAGAAVSNVFNLDFVLGTRYTNDTAYYAEVGVGVQYNIIAANSCSSTFSIDTNVTSNTYDFSRIHVFSGVAIAGTFRDTTVETVPPYSAFKIANSSAGSSSVSIVASEGSITYFATNAASGGGGDVTQAGLAAGSYPIRLSGITTNTGSFNGSTGCYVDPIAARYSQVFSGTNNVVTNSTFCTILSGTGGTINQSILSTIIGADPSNSTIYRGSACFMVGAVDGIINNALASANIATEHGWIFGGSSFNSAYNLIAGGDVLTMGDEFGDSAIIGSVMLGGRNNTMTDNATNSMILCGKLNLLSAGNNSIILGSQNNSTGSDVILIGTRLTNTLPQEVVIGNTTGQLRITNGVISFPTVKNMIISGDSTNTSDFNYITPVNAATSLNTNINRRALLYWSGTSASAATVVTCEVVTYVQGNTSTNRWGKASAYDAGSGATVGINAIPINPNGVFYVNTFGSSMTTYTYRIVYQ